MECLPASPNHGFQFRYASDQSVLLDCGDVANVARWFSSQQLPGVLNVHPAYQSILIVFNPLTTNHAAIEAFIQARWLDVASVTPPETRLINIPVRYGGADGPDLQSVAELHGITPQQVIEGHTSAIYRVSFLGFVPGFAYLSGLPESLVTPRLSDPRKIVPAGSVGIAGNQSGVYPFATPGGWRLIGRTPESMFDPSREPMSLLETGDHVRFVPL